jgi:hypothetical protein
MINLPGVEQLLALVTREVNAVPFGAVEGKARNRQGLPGRVIVGKLLVRMRAKVDDLF